MESLFVESNCFATVLGGPVIIERELELTVPLSPHVSFRDIVDMLGTDCTRSTAIWLDRECAIVRGDILFGHDIQRRYSMDVKLMSGRYCAFGLYQVPGTTELGAPLPALDFLIDRLSNYDLLHSFEIISYDDPRTLDVSPACFSNLLQTSRFHGEGICSVKLLRLSLTAEQTKLLFTHDSGPIFIDLDVCRFHGPTLLQLGSAALRREQTHLMGRGSHLTIKLDDTEIGSTSSGELAALLSNPHLRYFRPFIIDNISFEKVKKIVSALAANKISRLEILYLGTYFGCGEIEWEEEGEASVWIDLWKAVAEHLSLKEIYLTPQPGLCQQSWWEPIAAAVRVNPRLVHVGLDVDFDFGDQTWEIKLAEQVEPLLARNQYRPRIASLCCTDPSHAAVFLGQAIVSVACTMKNAKCRHEIHRMLLDQLALTGYDFGVGFEWVLAENRPLVDTVVVVANDVAWTEPRVADIIASSANDNNNNNNNESNDQPFIP